MVLPVKVDEEPSKLLTNLTPFGRLQVKRLLYGIHSTSKVFQQGVKEIAKEITKTIYQQIWIDPKLTRHLH